MNSANWLPPSLANEKPGQTLQATALVHDAYIRLVDVEKAQHWDSRGHFFAAAAEAMRRILDPEQAPPESSSRKAWWRDASLVELNDADLAVDESSNLDRHAGHRAMPLT